MTWIKIRGGGGNFYIHCILYNVDIYTLYALFDSTTGDTSMPVQHVQSKPKTINWNIKFKSELLQSFLLAKGYYPVPSSSEEGTGM